ncbi:serine hydrolase [Motiliproteus sp. MSK22-1]|uniref:serine hydrolase domain-containing protein n=1 Tax=Motiliproteus sp. MSK22-1 TaxID=1897630 RepID=UPI002100B6E3|nr:serine hydrolase [Motiliproteus sp. MSK22-1]
MTSQPGTRFRYSSAGSHLLSALLYKLTGLNVLDYAKTHLFHPLGISKVKWSFDKQGHYHGGFGLDLAPESITRIGQLYLDKGNHKGTVLLPESYIREATSIHSTGGFPERDNYGYHWWVSSMNGFNFHYAAGLGGQYLFVVPTLDLLVTITSNSRQPHIENKALFTGSILPYYASKL